MKKTGKRITSLLYFNEGNNLFLVVTVAVFLFIFTWANAVKAAPVQSNIFKKGPSADLHVEHAKKHAERKQASVKRPRGSSGKQVLIADRAGSSKGKEAKRQGKAVKTAKTTKSGRGDAKLRRIASGKSGRHPHERQTAKKHRQQRSMEMAQSFRVRMKIHNDIPYGFNPPTPDQKEAFEEHLLMEQPLDDQTLNIIESAYSCMGIPYQWGGTTPDGFDCSGFIRYVFNENGIRMSRSSREQVEEGKAVPLSELRPGDLIFFKFYNSRNKERNRGKVNHVGLYIGDGRFIHAASNNQSHEITVDELDSGKYFQRIVEARRILDSTDIEKQ